MDYKKALPIVEKFISWATPKKVLQVAGAALVCIICMTIFEHRASLTERVFNNQVQVAPTELKINIPEDIKAKIKKIVDDNPDIIMIQVVSANMRINQRELSYYYTNDAGLAAGMANYVQTRTSGKPIFTADEKSNAQMVSVLNGEFGCYNYDDAMTSALMPRINSPVKAICRVALPPYYGSFSGYLGYSLNHVPDKALQEEIRIDATKTATEIYFRSIGKKPTF